MAFAVAASPSLDLWKISRNKDAVMPGAGGLHGNALVWAGLTSTHVSTADEQQSSESHAWLVFICKHCLRVMQLTSMLKGQQTHQPGLVNFQRKPAVSFSHVQLLSAHMAGQSSAGVGIIVIFARKHL